MACTCSHEPAPIKLLNSKFRIALWIALVINLSMFLVELIGGAYAHSSSLWADSLDFFGDSVNYGFHLRCQVRVYIGAVCSNHYVIIWWW